ncbi:SMC-Scp complex subunit ScpB [Candidatus Desantisbacteria bacterium]|nr:SMC-Scp complex subunit ScpB [Candidatus Desantisbacteria bacterium]
MISEVKELKNSIECLLFVSGEPLSLKKIAQIVDTDIPVVESIIKQLQDEYQERGLTILEVAGGVQMCTNPQYACWIKKLSNSPNNDKLSVGALEALAVIAYNQPVTKAEIEFVRGVNSVAQIQKLLEKRLAKVVGRKDVPGHPFLYGTTKEFLKCFGLSDISYLPPISSDKKVEMVG